MLFLTLQQAELVQVLVTQTLLTQFCAALQLPQFRVPPQPLEIEPQFLLWAAQVVGVQTQAWLTAGIFAVVPQPLTSTQVLVCALLEQALQSVQDQFSIQTGGKVPLNS